MAAGRARRAGRLGRALGLGCALAALAAVPLTALAAGPQSDVPGARPPRQESLDHPGPRGSRVPGPRAGQAIGVPAYFAPGPAWTAMDQASPAVALAVMNPDSGPGPMVQRSYTQQVAASTTAGLDVLGYVATGNGGRSLSVVETEVGQYLGWYGASGLAGIFFDQADADCATVATYYVPLYWYVKTLDPDATVVLNAGTAVGECYMSAADILVNFEGFYTQYVTSYQPLAWTNRYPPVRFWHIVHDVPSPAALDQVIRLSQERRAGYVYATDEAQAPATATCPGGGSYLYDRLPCPLYWAAELGAVGRAGERPTGPLPGAPG